MRRDPSPTWAAEAIKEVDRGRDPRRHPRLPDLARPWGFDLRGIEVEVGIWQGDDDAMVPVADAELARRPDPGREARRPARARATSRFSATTAPRSSAWLAEPLPAAPGHRLARARRRHPQATGRPRCSRCRSVPTRRSGPARCGSRSRPRGSTSPTRWPAPASTRTRRRRRAWSATRSRARSSRWGRGSRRQGRRPGHRGHPLRRLRGAGLRARGPGRAAARAVQLRAGRRLPGELRDRLRRRW